jgi:hypothetical protein
LSRTVRGKRGDSLLQVHVLTIESDDFIAAIALFLMLCYCTFFNALPFTVADHAR